MKSFNPGKIDKKWQAAWEESGIYHAEYPSEKKKWYSLIEFPYPSGAGLHTGHLRSFTAMDLVSRKRRMEGYNVLYPIGWDAFGLPTENYAIKTGVKPQVATAENVATFKRQLQSIGISFDWSREVNTTDPDYYKWTQWIFLQFFKKGLAYKAARPINWCLDCKIGLAEEEVVGGVCERCGGTVEKRNKEQWMLRITAYAEKLLEGLDGLDYLPEIKLQQRNWIGKSVGARLSFQVTGSEEKIEVFTTRPDTLYGATYMVLAPEHPLVETLKDSIENWDEVAAYQGAAKNKKEIERTAEGKEKTGVALKGVTAINPATKEEVPVWISDYVLVTYGTGAIMAVPAHDERDFAFAKTFDLPITQVIEAESLPYTGEGTLMNSGEHAGTESATAKKAITEAVGGQASTTYKLRDWVFSRQRYWGEPIPVIHCEGCGMVPVPEKDLPVTLPDVEKYEPRDDGESPLASVEEWVNVACPTCDGPAKRETDVMPNWAGSSWYFLRYTDPKNDEAFANKESLAYFTPIDWYNGGMEHVTLHLLYSRFWNLFLYDEGLVPEKEPYKKRTKHGMILGPDGKKMSKSKGNVVAPDPLVKEFGADALRLYVMFMGPFDQMIPWDKRGILGTSRFLEKVWRLHETNVNDEAESPEITSLLHKTIKKVGEDIESMSFNTAISQMMVYINEAAKEENINQESWKLFTQILAPFAPHTAEEMWEALGEESSVHTSEWPAYDEEKTKEDSFELVIQVNGKVRGTVEANKGIAEEEATEKAKNVASVAKYLEEGEIKKVIYVPDRLINLIVG